MQKETVTLPAKGIFPETEFPRENNEIRIKIARYKQLINEDTVSWRQTCGESRRNERQPFFDVF